MVTPHAEVNKNIAHGVCLPMTTASQVKDLLDQATRRVLTHQETAGAVEWLDGQQRDEIATALTTLAELESKRVAAIQQQADARAMHLELISKHVAPRLLWFVCVILMAGAYTIATRVGLPLSFIFDDLP